MNYREFISEVREQVQKLCEKNSKVIIQKVIKNNSLELDGLVIQREGQKASPTIYLNGYYKKFLEGELLENIVGEIFETDKEARDNFSLVLPKFEDISQMRDKIMFKLVNTDRNDILLDKIPHREYLDLSLVYYCMLDSDVSTNATFLINNRHMDMWGVDEQMLYDTAMKNTFTSMPSEIVSMEKMLCELMNTGGCTENMKAEICEQLEESGKTQMYVLSNKNRSFGAVCVLDKKILSEFADEHGSFYILPSSVHEVILIPAGECISQSMLCDIVRDVNETQVPADEILSDNVYIYDSIDREMSKLNFINFQ